MVGAGQSAAEVDRPPAHAPSRDAEVCAVFTSYGYTPADDSSFANRIFDPEAVDDFYAAPDEVKSRLLGYHASTNYSVVDLEVIDELYRRHYQEKVRGTERLRILNASRLVEVEPGATDVRATVEFLPTGERTPLDADAVVFATGYRPADPLTLLGAIGEHCAGCPAAGCGSAATTGSRRRSDALRHLRPGGHRAHPRPHLDAAVQHRGPGG